MKTFQNKILNPVLSGTAILILVSGCDLTSLRSSIAGNSSKSSTSSVASTAPTTTTSRHDDGGYGGGSGFGGGSEFGGYSSKKQSQQKSSYPSPSYPSKPSYGSSQTGQTGQTGSFPGADDDGWPSQGHHSPQHPGDAPDWPDTYAQAYGEAAHASNHSLAHGSTSGASNPANSTHAASTHAMTTRSSTGSAEAGTVRRPIGESCSGSGGICLAVKYVSYLDGRGDDVESETDAVRDIDYANQIWRDCGIQFQLEDYRSVQPQEYDLRYRTRNYDELNQIRQAFSDQRMLLVVATGKWDRSGSLGNSWANAWTNLPGEHTYGVVLERSVTGYPQILAHELGHYLSLDHNSDPRSLMHPVVARNSIELSRQECKEARWAAFSYWREMMR